MPRNDVGRIPRIASKCVFSRDTATQFPTCMLRCLLTTEHYLSPGILRHHPHKAAQAAEGQQGQTEEQQVADRD